MKKKNGFTMTEVIITMILVLILSLISMPLYRGRVSNKAKIAEGYALLGAIKEAQFNYYNEYGYFLHSHDSYMKGSGSYIEKSATSIDSVLGINAINNVYFSSFTFDHGRFVDEYWKYSFNVQVFSEKAGTIAQMFNLTKKSQPTVINPDTGWLSI